MKKRKGIFLSVVVGMSLMTLACKKDAHSLPMSQEKDSLSMLHGNFVFKSNTPSSPKGQSSGNTQSPTKKLGGGNEDKSYVNGRHYTTKGVVDGIKFNAKDGNTVYLEKSKAPSTTTQYNIVFEDRGYIFVTEHVKLGMSKSEVYQHAQDHKWPDNIANAFRASAP